MSSMRCPGCNHEIPEGSEFCPVCGVSQDPKAWSQATGQIDQSQFDLHSEETYRGPLVDSSPRSTLDESQLEWEYWAADQGVDEAENAPAASGAGPGATRVLESDPERGKATRVLQAPPPPRLPPRPGSGAAAAEADSILSEEFEHALAGIRAVYKRLHAAERVAFWSIVVAFVGAFSPWYYVKGTGLVSGVETIGWIAAACLGAALILVYVRFQLRWGLGAALVQILLTTAGGVLAAYVLIEPGARGAPTFGLPATVAAAVVGVVAEIVGLLARV